MSAQVSDLEGRLTSRARKTLKIIQINYWSIRMANGGKQGTL